MEHLHHAKLTPDDIKFLEQLQTSMPADRIASGYTTTSAVYYCIMDFEDQVTESGHEDRIDIYDPDTCETQTLEEWFQALGQDDKASLADENNLVDTGVFANDDGSYTVDCPSALAEYARVNFCVIPVYIAEVEKLRPGTLFLTREAAENHLKSEGHHYSAKARAFAMAAWRCPQIERLYRILDHIDWQAYLEPVDIKN